jgi:iron complex outermembrane receptor protein
MKRPLLVLGLLPLLLETRAQSPAQPFLPDSSDAKTLQEVMVKAYEQNRHLSEVAAPVSITGQNQLNRFGNTSILPALNMTPGVRMEERSPASYRVNIRGSSLRSPFGVRDVKIYFDEIPLTDPGGNTYLNQLAFYNFQSIELIKGPAGSLYGAGIGGALLINSRPSPWEKGIRLDYTLGSYQNNSLNAEVRFGTENRQNNLSFSHQTSDGYRVQSKMRRDLALWETTLKASEKQMIHAFIFYGDLYYQTPGGLTLAQYNQNPAAARPATATQPSAVQAQAAIYQKNFTAGFSQEYRFSEHWRNTTSFYGAYTDFNNPGIRVYEERKEPHFGGRSIFEYKDQIGGTSLQFDAGAEAQKGFFNTKDYSNKSGSIDSLQTDDNINTWTYMIFAQGDLRISQGWTLTAGVSLNRNSVNFTRISIPLSAAQTQNFDNKVAPRIALLRKLGQGISVYASAARGFSTPTVSELLKSSNVNNSLQPEDGIDYEIGARGNLFRERLYFDLDAFFFHLKNTIVQRIDTNGVMYSVNAGATRQNGVEAYISYQLTDQPSLLISSSKIWISGSWQDFHYIDFKQLSAQAPVTLKDFSGHQLPGIAPYTLVAGADLVSRPGVYLHITYTYTDNIFLNDANTDHAASYILLGARAGFRKRLGRIGLDFFAGADNLLNTRYSLGNDINAAAGRYYNGAPGTNYFGGISLRWLMPQ